MNTILLFIWLHVIIISLICFYYNEKIIAQFIEMNTPKQPPTNNKCLYSEINTVDVENLSIYKIINGVKTYKYRIGNIYYAVSTDEIFYVMACSGLCTAGLTPTGVCISAADQERVDNCESLIKPKSGCVSRAKPIFQYKNIYYYINSAIII